MVSCRAVLLFMTFIIFTSVDLLKISNWGNKRPLFPTNKIPEDGLSTRRAIVRRKIVLYHNFFRTKVRPTASNMLLMSWHREAAYQAQAYADKCVFLEHNHATERLVTHLGECGQNLLVSTDKTPWFHVLKLWFLEYKNLTYGKPANLKDVGHYTQMVWATTHKVGCGMAHCKGGPYGQFYNYVCHYCPGGNIDGQYFYPYKLGAPCGDCPNNCVSGSLCSNSCPYINMYNNCGTLVALRSFAGICDRGECNATCNCGTSKLYKNYPWN